MIQQFAHFAVELEATVISTERIRYYIKVSVNYAVDFYNLL